jgi:hypothetical protein
MADFIAQRHPAHITESSSFQKSYRAGDLRNSPRPLLIARPLTGTG